MNEQRLQDKVIVERILAGDTQAVRVLYKDVTGRLAKYFGSQVQQTEDVDELVHDTFLHLLDALPLFQFQSTVMTFVMGIARHELMDYWRKKYAKRMVRTVPLLRNLPIEAHSSQDTSTQIHQAMKRAYVQLKPLQMQLLKWKYEDEKSVKEIAELLGMTVKSVEAHLYRARKAFQVVYEQ